MTSVHGGHNTDLGEEDVEELVDVGVVERRALVEQNAVDVVGEERRVREDAEELAVDVLRLVHLHPQLGEQRHVQRYA